MKKAIILLSIFIGVISCNKDKVIEEPSYAEYNQESFFTKYDVDPQYESLDENLVAKYTTGVELGLKAGTHENQSIELDHKILLMHDVDVNKHFSYYIPKNLGNNYDIVFEFHGNSAAGNESDLLMLKDYQRKFFTKKNTIFVKPLGSKSGQTGPNLGWYEKNGDVNYFDILVGLIKQEVKRQKGFECADIFVTGQSSGAIFSWVLSGRRADVISAAVPRFGQKKTVGEAAIELGTRSKAPMRVLAGTIDPRVSYTGVEKNISAWATQIWGLTENDPGKTTYTDFGKLGVEIPKPVTIRSWGSNHEVELYSLQECGHGWDGIIRDYDRLVYSFMMKHKK